MGAIAAYAVWIGCQPNKRYAQVFFHMGDDCERQQCPLREQIKLAEKVIYHDPTFSNGYNRMGYLSRMNDQIDRSVLFHQLALFYDFQNRSSLVELGMDFFQKGDTEMSLKYLQQAIALSDHGFDINYYLGRVYERKKDYAKASQYYRRATQNSPENMNAIARLGAMEFKKGYKESCLSLAEQIRQKGEASLASELETYAATGGKTEFMAFEK